MTHGPVRPAAPITGLSHVQLRVSDLGSSAAWYTTVLGLERQAEDLDAGYVALRHRRARLVIVLSTEPQEDGGGGAGAAAGVPPGGEPPGRPERARRPERLDHLAFAVPDGNVLRAWAAHLAREGIHHGGVVLEDGNPSLQLRDPDGNAIELVAAGPATGTGGGPSPGRSPRSLE